MGRLSPGMLERLRHRLERLQHQLAQELDGLRRHGLDRALTDSVGELSSYDQHTADLGSETFERSKDSALLERVQLALGEVKEALARMDQGRYGQCQTCGRFIGFARLLALPYARRCVACQAEHDDLGARQREGRAVGRRPLEEAVLMPPFGRGNLPPGGEDPGLGAEDVWQMVARHGNANTPQDVPGAVDYDEVWESADTEEPGGTQEVEYVPDVGGTGVVDPTGVYPDPQGTGRRRPRPAGEGEEPDTP